MYAILYTASGKLFPAQAFKKEIPVPTLLRCHNCPPYVLHLYTLSGKLFPAQAFKKEIPVLNKNANSML